MTVKHTIYNLKHQYGVTISLYEQEIGSTDRKTGVQTVTRTKHEVTLGVLLPVTFSSQYIFRNNTTVQFEIGDREVLLDLDDLPYMFDIRRVDYVVFGGKRYSILRFQDIESQALYIHLRETQEQQTNQDITVIVRHKLTPTQTITGEL